jgi:gamma-glutamyltranspeptidase/glutathione hydrolase
MIAKAASSHPEAEHAAQQTLSEGGNCIDAAIAGFFAAAAVDPGALCAPIGALVGGVGRGARSIDGRSLQPGGGRRRPRGLAPGQPIPAAAFAAAPRSLAALTLLHAYGAAKPLGALVRPAAALARKSGASARAELIEAIAARGAGALQRSEVARLLLIAAGPGAGGMLGEEDLVASAPGEERAATIELGGGATAILPAWQLVPPPAPPSSRHADESRRQPLRAAEVMLAGDAAGSVAALAWAPDPDGIAAPELGLALPRDAAPVMRGVPRVTPGSPRPAALPIALVARASEGWYAAIGVSARPDIASEELRGETSALTELLARLADAQRGAVALAATASRGKVQILRVAGRR